MSVPGSVMQDLAVLKNQHADLRRTVDEGNRVTQAAIAHLDGRMDTMGELMARLAEHSAKHQSQSEGLQRAFNEIEATDEAVAELKNDEAVWRKQHERDNSAVEKRMTLWQGIGIGISLCVGAAVGAAMWGGSEMLQTLRGNISNNTQGIHALDQRVDKLERDAAVEHAR